MAKPYKEGRGWSMRERFKGQDLYESGHATAAKAKKAVRDRISAIEKRGQPVGFGPTRTTLAQALSDYALEMLPNMKGARQEAQRINNYLRAAGLPTLIVTPKTGDEHPEENVGRFSKVTLSLSEGEVRPVVASLAAHRAKLSTRTAKSDALRRQLARTRVSEITRDQVQEFLSTSSADGLSAATVSLERSLLRVFFNRARTRWNWAAPSENPATDLVLAPINNDRDRVLSAVEEEALFEAMADCGNAFIPLATRLLLETAMRCSDLLHYAKWGQVDRESYMLHLNDAKTGKRDVPLSPLAVDGLIALRKAVPSEDDDPLMPLSYEALKAGFERACERAGIKNLHLHDLRHTAATRMAKLSGSPFIVQQLTGHKSWASVMRYIHVKPVDALAYLHGAAARR